MANYPYTLRLPYADSIGTPRRYTLLAHLDAAALEAILAHLRAVLDLDEDGLVRYVEVHRRLARDPAAPPVVRLLEPVDLKEAVALYASTGSDLMAFRVACAVMAARWRHGR
jgi:hypothetical protein